MVALVRADQIRQHSRITRIGFAPARNYRGGVVDMLGTQLMENPGRLNPR